MDITYQLVTPGNHRHNIADISIQTFKNHFIAGILCADMRFQLQLWYRMLQQAIISLKIICKSILHLQISAYAHLYGKLEYNHTTLALLGTKVVIQNRPGERAYWEPHGKTGWYIIPYMEHYICHKSHLPKKTRKGS